MGFVQDMAKLISQMEGWNKNTPAWKNNNPGNLVWGKTMLGKDNRGYAIFATLRDGWGELEDLIVETVRKHPSLTFQTFFAGERDESGEVITGGYAGYAPASDQRGPNSPNVYANFVASGLQLAAGDTLIGKMPNA